MRYGFELKPQGAIAPDIEVGIKLQKLPAADAGAEQAIVVPDDCPECPEACTPTFLRWQYSAFGFLAIGESSFFYYPQFSPIPEIGSPGTLAASYTIHVADEGFSTTRAQYWVFAPIIDRCGHRTRFVLNNGAGADFTFYDVARGGYASWDTFSTQPAHAQVLADMSPSNLDSGHWTTSKPITEDAVRFVFSGLSWSTIKIRVQIDLTDAAFGSETWTDIGPFLLLTTS